MIWRFLLVTLLVAVVVAKEGKHISRRIFPAKQYLKTMKQAMNTCTKEHDITADDWDLMKAEQKIPNDKNTKCMLACYLHYIGSMRDSTIKWDKIHDYSIIVHGYAPTIAFINACKHKVLESSDKCDVAASLTQCYLDEGIKNGEYPT